jgi:hypothetical protein
MIQPLETPRQDTADRDSLPIDPALHHTLTIPDVCQRYAEAGLPRNPRSVQRYAEAGKISATKIMTPTGTKYLVTPHSVDLHITELNQMQAQARLIATNRDLSHDENSRFETQVRSTMPLSSTRPGAHDRDQARPVVEAFEPALHVESLDSGQRQATTAHDTLRPVAPADSGNTTQTTSDQARRVATALHDQPRPVAHAPIASDERYLTQLERENDFLRTQIETKDGQIKELTERSRETNMLVAGLQKMLTPLLGRGDTIDLSR